MPQLLIFMIFPSKTFHQQHATNFLQHLQVNVLLSRPFCTDTSSAFGTEVSSPLGTSIGLGLADPFVKGHLVTQSCSQKQLLDSTVVGMQVPQAELPGGHRALTPVEMARIESLWRVCNLKVGRPADDSHQARPAAASGTETSGARAPTPRPNSMTAFTMVLYGVAAGWKDLE